jgi:hypothetical protein
MSVPGHETLMHRLLFVPRTAWYGTTSTVEASVSSGNPNLRSLKPFPVDRHFRLTTGRRVKRTTGHEPAHIGLLFESIDSRRFALVTCRSDLGPLSDPPAHRRPRAPLVQLIAHNEELQHCLT